MIFSARHHVLAGFVILAGLIAGFGGWATMGRLQGAVIATGQIVVAHDRHTLQHPEGGQVAVLHVADGDHVIAGQMLMRLDTRDLGAEHAIMLAQYFESLARTGRLLAERDGHAEPVYDPELTQAAQHDPVARTQMQGQTRLFQARADTLAQHRAQLHHRLTQITRQRDALVSLRRATVTQAELIAQEAVAQRRLLDQGLAHTSRVLALEREAARLSGSLGQLDADDARLQVQASEIATEIMTLDATHREAAQTELRDLDLRRVELAQRRLALTQRIARMDLRAPVSGRVLDLRHRAGGAVVRPAEPILQIVPDRRALVASIRIPPRQIDQVRDGQAARIRLMGRGYQDMPDLPASVTRIGADTLIDERTQTPYFEVELTLVDTDLPVADFFPGLPVEIFITTTARSPLAYLMDPLIRSLRRALRET